MSVTIISIPMLLISAAAGIIQSTMEAAENRNSERAFHKENQRLNYDLSKERIKEALKEAHPECKEADLEMLSKEYATNFLDADILGKTLKEYGFTDLKVSDLEINCKLQNALVSFVRISKEEPFALRIDSVEENTDEIANDINSEYALNVQEQTYNKIKERLKNRNLEINEEEVLEDDSIMLTVYID